MDKYKVTYVSPDERLTNCYIWAIICDMARKCNFEEKVSSRLEEIKAWCRNGIIEKDIARRLKIGLTTLNEYKIKFPDFAAALKEDKDFADNAVESALYQKALKGDVTAQIFWLKNRRPSQWKDRRDSDDSSDIIAVPIQITYSIRKEEPAPADNAEHPTV
jgi:hypothetical protein